MRKTVLLLVTMVVASMLGTGVALAAAISGTQGNDTLRGTRQVDQIYGLNGNDRLFGRDKDDQLYGGAGRDRLSGGPGADEIYGGPGRDRLFGGPGADYLNSTDGRPGDVIDCGTDAAMDTVVRDQGDTTPNCAEAEDDPSPAAAVSR